MQWVIVMLILHAFKLRFQLLLLGKMKSKQLEVKHHKENLENHSSQLSDYFYNLLSKYEIKFG